MQDMQLAGISEFVLNKLLLGESVSDEVVLELISEVNNCIKARLWQKIPHDFYRLSEYVISEVQFGDFKEVSTDMVLLYGKLWAVMNQAEVAEKEESLRLSIDDDAKRFKDKYKLFRAIRDDSGISHSDLARETGMSVSHLSQAVGKLDNGKYFISRQLGRRKYYYITDMEKN